ncbi:MAG: type VII secretion protein EccB [Propionibacteriaceae bacterium]|nr:type VII secretion protein EccB [Propionibacteriaceae bacterium]
MASNRDILEAQRFNRARLTTAFTSGLPDGRELEPRSGSTPMILGVIVTVLLVIVALVLNHFAPRLPDGWQNDHVLVIKGTGARYFTANGVMHPVTNITSAKLLAPVGSLQVAEVSESAVTGIGRGIQVGLADAPDDVPDLSHLDGGPWLACAVSSSATHTWIDDAPADYAPAPSALVTDGSTAYLVADGRKYPIDGQTALEALGLSPDQAHRVRADWLNLTPTGSPLAAPVIADAGQPTRTMVGALSQALIGQLVDVTDAGVTSHYVVATATTLVPLTDIAYRLYADAGPDTSLVSDPIQATANDLDHNTVASDTDLRAYPADWPTTVGSVVPATASPCLERTMTGGAAISVGGISATAAAAAPGQATVRGGYGVIVNVSNGGTLGALRLVSDNGFAYGLGEPSDGTLDHFGYTNSDVVVVPEPWAALIPAKDTTAPDLTPQNAEATL